MNIVVLVDVVLQFIVCVEGAFYAFDGANEALDDVLRHSWTALGASGSR